MSTDRTLRCYDYVNQPFERVRAALQRDAEGIFARATRGAAEREHAIGMQLHVKIGIVEVATDVRVQVGPREDGKTSPWGSEMTTFPISWSSAESPSLFPRMHAKLLVYPLSRVETQLEFDGSYDPPLGVLGDAIDAAIGHRIAEASSLHFLRDVAALLRDELASEGGKA